MLPFQRKNDTPFDTLSKKSNSNWRRKYHKNNKKGKQAIILTIMA
jgi:hypothetical protein